MQNKDKTGKCSIFQDFEGNFYFSNLSLNNKNTTILIPNTLSDLKNEPEN